MNMVWGMDKHVHVKIDSIAKAEAKSYAAKAPMSLSQLVEKALLEFMSLHPHKQEA